METEKLQKYIKYDFKDLGLLRHAMVHPSFSNEKYGKPKSHLASNQRLEFLGDSVLSLVLSTYLYNNYPDMPEGELSKLRAVLVCEASLAVFAKRIHLQDFLILGVGETASGGMEKPSILADAYESLIAAIYLDSGIESAREFIISQIESDIKTTAVRYKAYDYKTNLQEKMGTDRDRPIYEIIGNEGPDHSPVFIASVSCRGEKTFGKGHSKKEAEQMAAKEMLELIEGKKEK